jgi:PAS domain S-box-containing protein
MIVDVTERKRAETVLRESEGQFRTLVEQIKDYAIFRTDSAGRATTWNTGVENILGFKEAEFIGQDIVPLIFTPEAVENSVAEWELA